VMSNIPDVRTAADWRAENSLAALDVCLPGGIRGTAAVRGRVVLTTPRSNAAQGILMPEMRKASSQPSAFGEQDTRKKYQHVARVAAFGGNASGSHPASWDPV
jgi:hypothetical protein